MMSASRVESAPGWRGEGWIGDIGELFHDDGRADGAIGELTEGLELTCERRLIAPARDIADLEPGLTQYAGQQGQRLGPARVGAVLALPVPDDQPLRPQGPQPLLDPQPFALLGSGDDGP